MNAMAPPMSLPTRSPSKSLRHVDREHVEHRSRRREVFRRGAIVAAALSLATLVLGAYFVVGRHFVTAWWIEGLNGAVLWEIDETNWRQGGATTVELTAIRASNLRFSDSDLAHLGKLHRVVSLNLAENDQITNKGLAEIRGLRFLTELNLERMERYRNPQSGRVSVPLTDACLVHVLALSRLEVLTLSGNRITDQGLAQIARMRNLKFLDLEATEITDSGLVYIEGMKNLEVVNLGATRVTKQRIMQLQMARPDLRIELDSDPVVEANVERHRGVAQ
jgi:Leucine Rich repeat